MMDLTDEPLLIKRNNSNVAIKHLRMSLISTNDDTCKNQHGSVMCITKN